MKVALVYDRVNKFGGAERVLLVLHQIFPDAPLFTLVYDQKAAPWASVFNVYPTFLNSFPFFRSRHEWLAPFAAMAFETFDFKNFDVVISITSSDAKSVITKPTQLHLSYCLTPTRYHWSGEDEYKSDTKFKLIPKWLKKYFRTTDLLISKRPDEYIAISNEVKQRIHQYYRRESTVIYPSIDDKFYSKDLTSIVKRDKYLIVSRLVPYKKVDLAIRVFNKLKKPLIIVGTGSEENRLKRLAHKNIVFLGSVNDSDLIKLYQDAKAIIFPQEEDFGLVPIEAQACGTPVIAFGKAGALETIISGETGVFFNQQTVSSLQQAVIKFEKLKFDPQICQNNAKKFSENTFTHQFRSLVNNQWLDHLTNAST